MSIKDRIKTKRLDLGLNQTELAKKAGLTPPSISQYESGARNPSYDAILKLSTALGVQTDYLVSGVESVNVNFTDPMSEVIDKIMKKLTPSKKEKVIEYIFASIGQNKNIEMYASDPKLYAKYVYENFFDKTLPIDISQLLDKLNLKVVRGEIDEADGILLKSSNTIIINNKLKLESKIKFALTTLVGHYILPWHIDETYYFRKSGQSTLLTDNPDEMEAQSFTVNLITPPEELEKDLSKYRNEYASLKILKDLADEKYLVSLTSLCNRLVELHGDRFATVTSKNGQINKVFSNNISVKPIETMLHEKSKAFKLLNSQYKEETFLEGKENSSVWLDDEFDDFGTIYESSVFNPKYNSVYTLLTKIK